MPLVMPDDRSLAAIARIERALARIESASAKAPAPAANDGELNELRDVHHALRDKVGDAIAQIDRLLAQGARG